ncbi:helix-turn-helix domain-containing protein [Amnibacterium setariae]|nr:helix-turn-helix transcriptional regulator [Amnibacterium setariae]
MQITTLRQNLGWTQERLATESGVGVRTVQRLEAGHDASLETLSLVSAALRVPVRELFTAVEGHDLDPRVEAMALRTELQQGARDRMIANGRLLFFLVGIAVSAIALFSGQWGALILLAYWGGCYLLVRQFRRHVLEPRLDAAYPLSRTTLRPNAHRRTPVGGRLADDGTSSAS